MHRPIMREADSSHPHRTATFRVPISPRPHNTAARDVPDGDAAQARSASSS
jgi:hypothetical protein